MQSQASALQRSIESSTKFSPEGEALYFPGITIISEPKLGGGPNSSDDISNAILEKCFRNLEPEILEHYVVLPEPSLHMTVLDVIAYTRDNPGLSRAEIEKLRTEQIANFKTVFEELKPAIQQLLPIKTTVSLGSERWPSNGETLGVTCNPYDEEATRRLHDLRSMLAFRLDMPHLFQPSYQLHLTVAYPRKAMSDEDFETKIEPVWQQKMDSIRGRSPVYTIENIELCTFDAMLSFEKQSVVHAS